MNKRFDLFTTVTNALKPTRVGGVSFRRHPIILRLGTICCQISSGIIPRQVPSSASKIASFRHRRVVFVVAKVVGVAALHGYQRRRNIAEIYIATVQTAPSLGRFLSRFRVKYGVYCADFTEAGCLVLQTVTAVAPRDGC